jgi:hypothetical protein
MVYSGGNLIMVGGLNHGAFMNKLFVCSTVVFGSGWTAAPVPEIAPPPRDGHAIVPLNGVLYLFGGWNAAHYFNDLWA